MESHRQNNRGANAMAKEEAEDRLSALPDDLLLCILRDVPLKYAVRTSVLSRRWPRLWLRALATSPVLDFSDRDFARRQPPAQAVATVRRCLRRHAKRGAPLDAFRVAFRSPAGGFRWDVVSWVAAALARGAKEVAVDLTPTRWRKAVDDNWGLMNVDDSAFLELPANLFKSPNSLARLALVRCSLRAIPFGAPGLTGLRSLSLSHADVSGEAVRDILLKTCPSLEFLSLRSCNDLFHARIFGDKLRGLELVRCLTTLDAWIITPALESFVFHGDVTYSGPGGDSFLLYCRVTPALREAYLSLIGFVYADPEYYDSHCFAYYRMLISVAHATILTICSVGLQHMDTARAGAATMDVTELQWLLHDLRKDRNPQIDETRGFGMDLPNLQELQLLMPSLGDDDVDRIAGFFEFTRPPILDRLFIRVTIFTVPYYHDSHVINIFNSPAEFLLDLQLSGGKASCAMPVLSGEDEDAAYIASKSDHLVLDHLKFIKVVNFRGTRCEVRLLEILVSRAPALEQLVLVSVEGQGVPSDGQMKIVQDRVMAMRTASPVFRVVVCRPSEDGSPNPTHTRFYHEE